MQNSKDIQSFVRYFQDGCKEMHTSVIGIEIEHFVIDRRRNHTVSYYGEHGIKALLERLRCLSCFVDSQEQDGSLVALATTCYAISIEPAAQIEVSIYPRKTIAEIEKIYQSFLDVVEPILEEWDYDLVTKGYNPVDCSDELQLIPKMRYEYMDRHFSKIGRYGRCMMRGTASVQCSIDYYNEEDFVRTYRGAVAMGPLLALVTDNGPVFEGKPWKDHMIRTYIWERVDKARCSVVPGTFRDGFGFRAYAEYLAAVPAIFQEPGRELEHQVSIVFPDVRLKQYMEVRVADSMPLPYVLGYTALIKGMFKDREKLYGLYREMEHGILGNAMTEEAVLAGKEQLIQYGYDGEIYGQKPSVWLEHMVELAEEQLPFEERNYLKPIRELVNRKQSVRDVIR